MKNNKCVIVMEHDESDKAITCGRQVNVFYTSIIELSDGRKVKETIGVCSRHKEIMEEFLNNQGDHE